MGCCRTCRGADRLDSKTISGNISPPAKQVTTHIQPVFESVPFAKQCFVGNLNHMLRAWVLFVSYPRGEKSSGNKHTQDRLRCRFDFAPHCGASNKLVLFVDADEVT